ncbi:MAG: dihydrofolate reductase [Anaerolineales bacterium]|jgi:dihydrofolate reductase|nr:dihydrofolate reductase [Anaerolineales bacterium]
MLISIIVAMDEQRGIGKASGLPWRLSADLKRFKTLTMGHTLIMGRKTYQSIGRPLPGRKMIVVTRSRNFQAEGCQVAYSVEEALKLARQDGESEAFITGGGEIYRQALPMAERIYLTEVQAHLECDTFFPEFDRAGWQVSQESSQPADERNDYPTVFQVLNRQP